MDRHNRILWEREAAAKAAELGMDMATYSTLLSMQHREITPEDYEVLQNLDSSVKPKTLSKQTLDMHMPAWRVPGKAGSWSTQPPEDNALPATDADAEGREFEGKSGGASGASGASGANGSSVSSNLLVMTCSVCLCDLAPGEMARTLPCKHHFHMACIDAWLTENSHVCPADGLPVLPDVTNMERA